MLGARVKRAQLPVSSWKGLSSVKEVPSVDIDHEVETPSLAELLKEGYTTPWVPPKSSSEPTPTPTSPYFLSPTVTPLPLDLQPCTHERGSEAFLNDLKNRLYLRIDEVLDLMSIMDFLCGVGGAFIGIDHSIINLDDNSILRSYGMSREQGWITKTIGFLCLGERGERKAKFRDVKAWDSA